MAQKLYQQDLLDDAFKPKNDMLTVPTKNIPSVADVIGKTLPLIGKYNDLGRRLYTLCNLAYIYSVIYSPF